MTRHPFVHSSPLFLCIFFAYFILALFSCRTFSRAASSCFRFMSHFFCVAFILCLILSHFFIWYSFQVALFSCCILFICILFVCFTLLKLHLFSCYFMLHSLHAAPFLCCTHFVLHFCCIALFSSFTFLCCTLLMLHFSVLHHFQFSLFLSITFAPFFVLHCFDVVPFVHSFHVALFSCCTVFMLHLLVCCLMTHSVHVALFRYSGQQLY